MSHLHNHRGVGHAGMIIIIAIAALIGTGWWIANRQKDEKAPATANLTQAVTNASCDYNDKDLCKFFAAWKATGHYTIKAQQEGGGDPLHMTIQSQGKDNVHLTLTGSVQYETIVIGNTNYIKDNRDNAWWKQKHNTNSTYHASAADYTTPYEFTEPTKETAGNFKRISDTEACGNGSCITYEITNPDVPDDRQYIWFDNQTYQLRRMQTTGPRNSIFNAQFSYENTSITAPTPTKDLAASQYIIPGQNEPATIPEAPSAAELEQLLRQ